MSIEIRHKQGFQGLLVWQKAHELALLIYKDFRLCKDYGFKDQIQRAAVSVMNNIAEGQARRSDKSFKQFLLIAKGSVAEVQSMLMLASGLQYIPEELAEARIALAEETAKALSGFIKRLNAQSS